MTPDDYLALYITGPHGVGKSTLAEHFGQGCLLGINIIDSGPRMREFYENECNENIPIEEWVQKIREMNDRYHFTKRLAQLVKKGPNILIGWRTQDDIDAFTYVTGADHKYIALIIAREEQLRDRIQNRRLLSGLDELTDYEFQQYMESEKRMIERGGAPNADIIIENQGDLETYLRHGSLALCNGLVELRGHCEYRNICPFYQDYSGRNDKKIR